VPGDARARLEISLDLLRREWRDGCPAGNTYGLALGHLRRLRQLATNEDLASELGSLVTELERYPSLGLEPRRAILTAAATSVKRLIPQLASLDARYRPPEPPSAPKTPNHRRGTPPPNPAAPVDLSTPHFALDDPITRLKGAGGATSKKLAKLGVTTVRDLLFLSPRRHIDYSRTIRIGEALNLRPGSDVTVRGRVTDVQFHRGPGAPRVTIKLADPSGWVRVTWFNQYLVNVIHVGDEIAVSGALASSYGPLSFTGPEWERVGADGGVSTGREAVGNRLVLRLQDEVMATGAHVDLIARGVDVFFVQRLLEVASDDLLTGIEQILRDLGRIVLVDRAVMQLEAL